jgi:methyl-accepting chemotaxis protein
VGAIAGVMGDIGGFTTSLSDAIGEQNAAAGEISRNIGQAAVGTATVAQSIVGTAQATVETTRSADLVLAAARGLSSETAELRSSVDRFLANVAA